MGEIELKSEIKTLIVVDMINGFVEGGALADPHIKTIVPEVVRLVREFIESGNHVIAFRDAHTVRCTEFKHFPVHCLDGTRESELIDELKSFENNMVVFKKNSTSGMFAEGFVEHIVNLIKEKNCRTFIVVGCCSDLCITNLAIPLNCFFIQNNMDVEVVVPINAVETYDSDTHNRNEYNKRAFEFMEQSGIRLVKKRYETGDRNGR